MATTYFVINEELETSSGLPVTGAHLDPIVYTNKLISSAIVGIDVPAWASSQAISDAADSIFMRKKGTLDRIDGISDYQLTPTQAANLMSFDNWTDTMKDVFADVYGVDKANISTVVI